MTLDSQEEYLFSLWLEELKKAGFVKKFIKCENSISLTDPVKIPLVVKLHRKTKKIERHLLHGLSYTPDFEIYWSEKSDGIFYVKPGGAYNKTRIKAPFVLINGLRSLVDVKGTYAHPRQITSITFPIIQKILYEKGIYVQEIKPLGPKGLFALTFTPEEYLVTSTGKARKTKHFKFINLETYLKKQ